MSGFIFFRIVLNVKMNKFSLALLNKIVRYGVEFITKEFNRRFL